MSAPAPMSPSPLSSFVESAFDIDRFAHPWVFALLIAIPILLLIRALLTRQPAIAFSATARAASLGTGMRGLALRIAPLLRALALALLITAAAQPQAIEHDRTTTTEGRAIQLVIDRSGSMRDPIDLDGTHMRRFDAVKHVVAEFVGGNGKDLQGREGDLVGLIAFGTYADTITPLAREHRPLLESLSDLRIPATDAEQSTNIGSALAIAAARLKRTEELEQHAAAERGRDDFEITSKVIILLTDGRNMFRSPDPVAVARKAAEWGIRIYTVGVRGESRPRRIFEFTPSDDIDEPLLTEIADTTGGQFFAANTGDDVRKIYAAIDELETSAFHVDDTTQTDERFAPFVLSGLILLVTEALLRATLARRLP